MLIRSRAGVESVRRLVAFVAHIYGNHAVARRVVLHASAGSAKQRRHVVEEMVCPCPFTSDILRTKNLMWTQPETEDWGARVGAVTSLVSRSCRRRCEGGQADESTLK